MTVVRGQKSARRVRLTDALLNYSKSGKSDSDKWQKYSGILSKKGGLLRDSEIVGFQAIRASEDKISFRYDYRFNGRRKNITIGQFPAITVTQARALVKEKSLAVLTGVDPLTAKREAKVDQSNTLESYLSHEYELYMSRAISGKEYIAKIRNHFPELLNKSLSEINKTDLVKWVQVQMKRHDGCDRGYSSESIRSRYSTLKSLMAHAVRNGALDRSPFDKMEKLEFSTDELTKQQAKRTYLSINQQREFLVSLDGFDEKLRRERRNSRSHGKQYLPCLDKLAFASHHKPMLLILYYMGMRSGDVIGLDWGHIIDTPFACTISKVLEKTRRKIKVPFNLPMPVPVRDALKKWRAQQGDPVSGLVFPSPRTGGRMSKNSLDLCWKWVKSDAGFHDELQLYTLRHNFISWLIMNNIPIKVVAEMSGHKSIEMIDRYYSHLILGATADASDGFVSLLKGRR